MNSGYSKFRNNDPNKFIPERQFDSGKVGNKTKNIQLKLPESRHKQIDILKRKMERIAQEFIGRNTIVQINTLAHSIIRMQHFFQPKRLLQRKVW